jgi:hypothetical protein
MGSSPIGSGVFKGRESHTTLLDLVEKLFKHKHPITSPDDLGMHRVCQYPTWLVGQRPIQVAEPGFENR